MQKAEDELPEDNLLSKIDSPEDLRKLLPEQLPQVCDELRQMIIDELSQNPGHFGSSLGTVELTVALHYVFNTPDDRIVWDVGHQAPTASLRASDHSRRPMRVSMTPLLPAMPQTPYRQHWVWL